MSAPVPKPGPRPGPRPGPAAQPAPGTTPAPAPAPAPTLPASDPTPWGRVDEERNVYCRLPDGTERHVGQTPDMTPEAALAYFGGRYDELVFELDLLEKRIGTGALAPDDAAGRVKQLRKQVGEAKVVGDLAALDATLARIAERVKEIREERKAKRAEELVEARAVKERIVADAEKIAAGTDWRHGADRLRALLEEWKGLARLDKATDDELWKRFSTARTAYTRQRKAHFAVLAEKREDAKTVKVKLIKEAEALSSSTEWGPTAGAYRELMRRWKDAGPAPKDVDESLWQQFRAAQDTFFKARDEATAATDAEFAENATKKEALLEEAEKLVPVTDLKAAKAAFRDLAERWDAAGKVPRERMKDLEGRMRKVEQAIRAVEDDSWRRSNPEARARAADTVAQLETLIADLQRKHDAAVAAGNEKKAAEHAAALEARNEWLVEARKALAEFGG